MEEQYGSFQELKVKAAEVGQSCNAIQVTIQEWIGLLDSLWIVT